MGGWEEEGDEEQKEEKEGGGERDQYVSVISIISIHNLLYFIILNHFRILFCK